MHLQAQKHERFGNPRCTIGIRSIPDDDKQSNDPNPGALEKEPIEWQRCDKIHCKSAQKMLHSDREHRPLRTHP